MKILLLILTIISISFAHSGNKDTNGGHMDNKTGIYHCHSQECEKNLEANNVANNNVKNESEDDTSEDEIKTDAPSVIQSEEEKAYFPNDLNFKFSNGEEAYFPNDENFKVLYSVDNDNHNEDEDEEEKKEKEKEEKEKGEGRPILIKSQEKLKNKKSDLFLIDEVDKRNLWVKKITYTNGGNYKVEFYGDDKKYLHHDSTAIRALLLIYAEQKELRKERNKFEFIEDGYESR